MTSLAAKFQQASQTGGRSSLKPAHHGGHHHGGGGSSAAAAAYAQNDSTTVTGTSLQSQITDAISAALTQDNGTPAAAQQHTGI